MTPACGHMAPEHPWDTKIWSSATRCNADTWDTCVYGHTHAHNDTQGHGHRHGSPMYTWRHAHRHTHPLAQPFHHHLPAVTPYCSHFLSWAQQGHRVRDTEAHLSLSCYLPSPTAVSRTHELGPLHYGDTCAGAVAPKRRGPSSPCASCPSPEQGPQPIRPRPGGCVTQGGTSTVTQPARMWVGPAGEGGRG